MVMLYGMTDALGEVAYQSAPNPFLYPQGFPPPREISEATARMIDEEVRRIIESRMDGALKTLQEHEDLLHLIAEELVEKETIEGDEFLRLISRQPTVTPIAKEA